MLNINLYAGPGVGKSTIAAGLFYNMKIQHFNVEYIQEFAKELVYGKDKTKLTDQLYILGEQHHRCYRLKNDIDFLIHDSPILLNLIYLNKNFPKKEFKNLILAIFNQYNNLNIFLERNLNLNYQQIGRQENLEEAIKIDNKILEVLDENNIPFYKIKVDNNTIFEILKLKEINV